MRATGTFEVTLTPQTMAEGHGHGRLVLDKVFHGPLEAVSKGEMLAASSPDVKGSAGYVALEQVRGALDGREGTFFLQHTGVMNRGAPSLTITVVPDTGTGQLAGLSGAMNIIIEAGRHSYDLTYELPPL